MLQAIVGIFLMLTILMQSRGSGLGGVFGGDFGGYYTKRGLEKFLLHATIVLATCFLGLAAVNVYLSSPGV